MLPENQGVTQPPQTLADAARVLAMAALGVTQSCRCCGAPLSPRVRAAFMAGQRVKCSACGWRGTWREGTILHGSFISEIQFVAFFYRFSLPEGFTDIAKTMQLHPATVREWQKRIALHIERTA